DFGYDSYSELGLLSLENNTLNLDITPDTMLNSNFMIIDTLNLSGYFRCWIDYDDDKIFELEEVVYTSGLINSVDDLVASFDISQEFSGIRRMRMIFSVGQIPEPYGYYIMGETIDIDVIISDVLCNDTDLLCQQWLEDYVDSLILDHPGSCIQVKHYTSVCRLEVYVDNQLTDDCTLYINGYPIYGCLIPFDSEGIHCLLNIFLIVDKIFQNVSNVPSSPHGKRITPAPLAHHVSRYRQVLFSATPMMLTGKMMVSMMILE
ncbi:MAG TPA: hypothetical protein PK147_12720, partial [Saprospiraceae bacterium]|nr:hypothetical protein [Saprospiraceae bacterium]